MKDLQDFIEILKTRVSILDVVSRKVKLTKKGRDYFGLCPFHHEKTGSFKVDPEKGLYYCFGCSAHGNMFNFVMQTENVQFMAALETIANIANIKVPQLTKDSRKSSSQEELNALQFIKNQYIKSLSLCTNKMLSDYIKQRGISEDSIKKFEIGYANITDLYKEAVDQGFSKSALEKTGVFFNKSGRFVDKFAGRLIFPIFDSSDHCIGFGGRAIEKDHPPKYLNSPETDIFKKSHNLYAYNIAKKGKHKELIIVEGYMDVVSMHEVGFDRTIACLGTTISEHQINLCWKLSNAPIVMLDGDLPGIKAANRWLERIMPKLEPGKTFRFVRIPKGEDPDAAIKRGGKEYINDIIKSSYSLQDWLWCSTFELGSHDTPEDIAFILQKISSTIDLIQHKNIKIMYKQWFKQNEHNCLLNINNTKHKRKTKKALNVQAIQSKTIKMQEELLAIIINNPHIFDSIVEKFAMLDFYNSSYEWIKKEMLEDYAKNNTIENAIKKIYNKDLTDLLYNLLNEKCLAVNSQNKDALLYWNDCFDRYMTTTAEKLELEKIACSLKQELSYEDWNKYKILKQALIEKQKR